VHIGTLSAIIIYFIKDWWRLLQNGIIAPKSSEGKLFWLIILATFPAAIFGFQFEGIAETNLRGSLIIAIALFFGSIILYIADKKAKLKKAINNIGIKEALLIGFAQALAIIPGISRSGITIAAGLLMGLKREDAAKFSFLLATPIIFSAGLLKIKLSVNDFSPGFFIGILSSMVAGLFCINFLLNFLKKQNLSVFILYRIVLGLIVLVLTLMRFI